VNTACAFSRQLINLRMETMQFFCKVSPCIRGF
jgi:hypothetical protein